MKQFVVADETFLEIWLEQVLSARLQGVFFGGAGGGGVDYRGRHSLTFSLQLFYFLKKEKTFKDVYVDYLKYTTTRENYEESNHK